MPIRLLAVDLDGTLLTSGRVPHPDSAEAMRRAASAGVTVVLASGRIRTSMHPFAREVGLASPMISCNGAYIEDETGAEIDYTPLPMAVFEQVWPYAVETGAHLNVYTTTELLYLQETVYGLEYARRLKTIQPRVATVEEVRNLTISKILVMDQPERIVKHRAILEDRIDPLLGRATVSEPDYLEFLSGDVSKGKALQTLCRHLGIAQEETAAIGDYLNDSEMLDWAGLSATVRNGHPELHRIADVTVGTNDEGGVAEFIDDHILSRKRCAAA
ncbi:MAG TPA: Cof-type HAD-IIB family hydrolase [Fimbriimonas sp.]